MPQKGDIRYWTSLEYLPMRRFYKIVESQNLSLLLKISEERASEKKLNPKQMNQLAEVWEKLIQEYSILSQDKSFSHRLRKRARLGFLQSQYTTLQAAALLNAMSDPWVKEYLKTKRIKNIDKELKLLTNKISRITREIEAQERTNAAVKPKSVEEMVAEMQLAFNHQIDAEKMSTKQWIALQQKAKEISDKAKRKK